MAIRMHERDIILDRARIDIERAVSDISARESLTYGELVMIVGSLLQGYAKSMIREERKA